MTTKTVNVNELQAKISSILRETQKRGTVFEVMRYSEPVAVVLSYEDYLKLKGDCKRCVQDLRQIIFKSNSPDPSQSVIERREAKIKEAQEKGK